MKEINMKENGRSQFATSKMMGSQLRACFSGCFCVYLLMEASMSYDAVIDQVKSLPESSLEDVSRYIEFLLYQQEQDRMAPLIESDEVFEQKMERGYTDAMEGRVKPLDEVFADLNKRFA